MLGVLRLCKLENVQIFGTGLVSSLMLNVENGHTYENKLAANAASIKGLMY